MPRDVAYLLDILEAAKLAAAYVSAKTKEEFLRDTQCQDAVIRRLEIIGEAARRISQETRDRLPGLPWSAMINMRNLMIHEYDYVDLAVVWDTVQNHLPALIQSIAPLVPPPEKP
ncbi:MAG: DUF86 domain-containing protein [Terriglobia bacterium]